MVSVRRGAQCRATSMGACHFQYPQMAHRHVATNGIAQRGDYLTISDPRNVWEHSDGAVPHLPFNIERIFRTRRKVEFSKGIGHEERNKVGARIRRRHPFVLGQGWDYSRVCLSVWQLRPRIQINQVPSGAFGPWDSRGDIRAWTVSTRGDSSRTKRSRDAINTESRRDQTRRIKLGTFYTPFPNDGSWA